MLLRSTHIQSDKISYLLPMFAENWRLNSVVFLTTVVATTILLFNSSRTEAISGSEIGQAPLNTVTPAKTGDFHSPKIDQDSVISASLERLEASNWQDYVIRSEKSLRELGSRIGVRQHNIDAVLALGGEARYLDNLYTGDKLRLNVSDKQELLALQYDIHDAKRLIIVKTGAAQYIAKIVSRQLTIEKVRVVGKIEKSLYRTAIKAGLNKSQIEELVRIFDCNIDYSKDVKTGDRFTVIYERHFRGSEEIAVSPILAAQFINGEKEYNAVRYSALGDKPRYYTPNGISLHKTFLKNPVDYPIVSSKFNQLRWHPILHRTKAHTGVDYAAKRGTPIKATGDGFVQFRGRKGSYGKTVVIQHDKRQSTLYAHMHRYAKNLKAGDRVRQGDVIGYVGKTGRATGSHLHYEFRVDGVHVDPLKLRHQIIAIPEKSKYDFLMKSHLLLSQIAGIEGVEVAWNDSKKSSIVLN